ncbi:Hypothetical protein HDN1F_15410 [gamma proteobacterium HdN1]|nr:Hypothetical protein HDN1F_15410 [gamma proteobacterium HdN1]
MKLSNAKRIRGQGMSEYLVLVALVVVAAIAAVGLFGDTARTKLASATQELSGVNGDTTNTAAQTVSGEAVTDAANSAGMNSFQGRQKDY